MGQTIGYYGDIELRILGPEPKSWQVRRNYNFVEHKRLEGKPTLQQVGGVLDKRNLEIVLYSRFVDVAATLQALRDKADRQEADDLIQGTEVVGRYVIASMDEDVQRYSLTPVLDEDGEPTGENDLIPGMAKIKLQLTEFDGRDLPTEEVALNTLRETGTFGFPAFA